MRRRFIADTWTLNGLRPDTATLTGDQAAHLARVLRAQPGQIFDVVAGGFLHRAEVLTASPETVTFQLHEELQADAALPLHLYLAIFKFDHLEWAIEKATELGVSRITPILARRTEKHLAQAAAKRVERWRRIAHEASQQSRRTTVPTIADPTPLKFALQQEQTPTRILLSETEQTQTLSALLQTLPEPASVALAIGHQRCLKHAGSSKRLYHCSSQRVHARGTSRATGPAALVGPGALSPVPCSYARRPQPRRTLTRSNRTPTRRGTPMLRIPYPDLESAFHRAALHLGLQADRAALCAQLFAQTDRDGVRTHGLARFPRFAAMVRNGAIDPAAAPTFVTGFGAVERWNGNRGPGNLNAHAAMVRAIALARHHGIGAVALANTNHWMRGGSYGWQAAAQGLFAACWTNTLPNTPAWGTAQPTLGNNPLILAIPRGDAPVVLDMATTQFSMGALAAYAQRGAQLPVPGGYDAAGNLTQDPTAIEASQRTLPIGFWKGSGLSLTLDLFAAMLSGGQATHQLPLDPLKESGLSQFFLAIDPTTFADPTQLAATAEAILANLHAAPPLDPAHPPRYPGEETLRLRHENLALGVPVDPALWSQLTSLTL